MMKVGGRLGLDWVEGVVLGLMNDEGWKKARFGLG